jgi:hypothetical protein
MSVLLQANSQWRTRPEDQRFTSLHDMRAHFWDLKFRMRSKVVSSRQLDVIPREGNVFVRGHNGADYSPTNWAFSQLAQRAGAPAGYLSKLPAELAADCLNYGLKFGREVDDVGILYEREPESAIGNLHAATGPNYGRVWNLDLVNALIERVGDGVTGTWRVPGEFGCRVEVSKDNTTLYASDRDLFIFLADEENRIEIPNRRDGRPGSLARGFWVSNSEVGAKTLLLGAFLFDYVCQNRMVWGAQDYKEIRIRHTASAPDRWAEELLPALNAYAQASAKPFEQAIRDAQNAKVDKVEEFLAGRYSKGLSEQIRNAFTREENRPIETRWDVATAITAYAKGIPHQDKRVEFERQAGQLILPS